MLYIFDWDGTVCDSAAKIVASMQRSAEEAGVHVLSDLEIKNIIGLGLPEAVRTLYPELGSQQQEAVREGYSRHFLSSDEEEPCALFDGAMTTLQALIDEGYRVAVATGKSRRGLDRVLKRLGLDSFFHATRCADETASKPNPKMLQELLTQFSLSSEEAVMVGDTEYDMAMAEAIGMPRIAVSYGAHAVDRLTQYKPDLIVNHFSEIAQFRFASA